MSIAVATFIAKPVLFDCGRTTREQTNPKDSGVVGAGHPAALLDDPDLCPPWPPLPFPHHSLVDAVASLTTMVR